MTETKHIPKQPSLIETVMDAISLRSVFGFDLSGRIDRLQLIETAREHIGPDTDPALIRELLARRTETILALATFPSRDMDSFGNKAEAIGPEVTFPDISKAEYILLSLATWSALISDARDVGAVVSVASSTPGSPAPATH